MLGYGAGVGFLLYVLQGFADDPTRSNDADPRFPGLTDDAIRPPQLGRLRIGGGIGIETGPLQGSACGELQPRECNGLPRPASTATSAFYETSFSILRPSGNSTEQPRYACV